MPNAGCETARTTSFGDWGKPKLTTFGGKCMQSLCVRVIFVSFVADLDWYHHFIVRVCVYVWNVYYSGKLSVSFRSSTWAENEAIKSFSQNSWWFWRGKSAILEKMAPRCLEIVWGKCDSSLWISVSLAVHIYQQPRGRKCAHSYSLNFRTPLWTTKKHGAKSDGTRQLALYIFIYSHFYTFKQKSAWEERCSDKSPAHWLLLSPSSFIRAALRLRATC